MRRRQSFTEGTLSQRGFYSKCPDDVLNGTRPDDWFKLSNGDHDTVPPGQLETDYVLVIENFRDKHDKETDPLRSVSRRCNICVVFLVALIVDLQFESFIT